MLTGKASNFLNQFLITQHQANHSKHKGLHTFIRKNPYSPLEMFLCQFFKSNYSVHKFISSAFGGVEQKVESSRIKVLVDLFRILIRVNLSIKNIMPEFLKLVGFRESPDVIIVQR